MYDINSKIPTGTVRRNIEIEAIKRFVERLKQKMHKRVTMSGEPVLSIHPRGIDNLVKEMEGDT